MPSSCLFFFYSSSSLLLFFFSLSYSLCSLPREICYDDGRGRLLGVPWKFEIPLDFAFLFFFFSSSLVLRRFMAGRRSCRYSLTSVLGWSRRCCCSYVCVQIRMCITTTTNQKNEGKKRHCAYCGPPASFNASSVPLLPPPLLLSCRPDGDDERPLVIASANRGATFFTSFHVAGADAQISPTSTSTADQMLLSYDTHVLSAERRIVEMRTARMTAAMMVLRVRGV